jgi:hypothetical protein
MNHSSGLIDIFEETISHCRWKTVLYAVLKEIDISKYENKKFEEIIVEIYGICNEVKGLGMLTIYDITSAICRYYKINIDKVYIIGKGPKRATKILKIKTKTYKINDKIKIKFIDIHDILCAFDSNGYEINENIRSSKNGDIFETYICNWQKSK